MQAAKIAAKDVSALRKASGPNWCTYLKDGVFKLVAPAAARCEGVGRVAPAVHRVAVVASRG